MMWLRQLLGLSAALITCVLLPATAATAGPEREHFKGTFTFTETGMDNPCTPEFDDITLHITDRVHLFEWMDGGTFFGELHVSGHAHGVAADGTVYEGKLNVKSSLRVNGGETEQFQVVHRLISHGSAPNLVVQEWGTFTAPPPTVTFDRVNARCVG